MTSVLLGIGIYLGLGLIALLILDLLTKRVRSRLVGASLEAQGRMLDTGQMVGRKTAIFLTVGALWLFWVVAIYGALTKTKQEEPTGEEGQREV